MIKPLGPGLEAFLSDLNNLLAEAAPEPCLAIAAHSAVFPLLLDCLLILNLMVFLKMILESLPTMTSFSTDSVRRILQSFVTFPDLELKMLAILMALPVVFAPKLLGAIDVGAPVRLLMAFHMLSVFMIREIIKLGESERAYFSSQRRTNDLLHPGLSHVTLLVSCAVLDDEAAFLDLAAAVFFW